MNRREVKRAPVLRFKGFTNDWEQRTLKKLGFFYKGKGYTKKDLINNGVPILLYGELYTHYSEKISNTRLHSKLLLHSIFSAGNEVVLPDSGETSTDIARASWISNSGIILAGGLIIIKPNEYIFPGFLAYSLTYGENHKLLASRAQGKSIVHIHANDLKTLNIIYPENLKEQQRIFALLEKLNKCIALQQRKLESFQFTYHEIIRRLFLKKAKWQQTKLSDLVTILDKNRKPVKKEDRLFGDTPYYGANGIQDYISGFTHKGEFILIAEDGANNLTEYPIYFVKGQIWVNNHAHVLKVNKDVSPLFLTLALKQINYSKYTVGSSRNKLNLKDLENIAIFIPDNNEQQKIGQFYSNYLNYLRINKKRIQYMKQFKQFLLQNMFI